MYRSRVATLHDMSFFFKQCSAGHTVDEQTPVLIADSNINGDVLMMSYIWCTLLLTSFCRNSHVARMLTSTGTYALTGSSAVCSE